MVNGIVGISKAPVRSKEQQKKKMKKIREFGEFLNALGKFLYMVYIHKPSSMLLILQLRKCKENIHKITKDSNRMAPNQILILATEKKKKRLSIRNFFQKQNGGRDKAQNTKCTEMPR